MPFQLHLMLQNDCFLVGESSLCQLLLMNDSRYPWFILVPKKENITEIFQLSEDEQIEVQKTSSFLSEQLYNIFKADKMNIAALGNMCPQLHIHHIVRYKTDDAWPSPIWGQHPAIPYTENQKQALIEKLSPQLSTVFQLL